MKLFYKRLFVNYNNINFNRPTIFIANHPNSFFDAILLGVLLNRPIYSLTRGDVFKQKWLVPLLRAINLIPIYRLKDGKAALNQNEASFNACISLFNANKDVLIFGEAKCDGQYALLPLQKGGIKIAIQAWKTNSSANDLQIIPVALNYSNLKGWSKVGSVIFGMPFTKPLELNEAQEPFLINRIKHEVQLFFDAHLIQYNEPFVDEEKKKLWNNLFEKFKNEQNSENFKTQVLAGLNTNNAKVITSNYLQIVTNLLYFPLFYSTSKLCYYLNKIGKVHYDSMLFCISILFFPLYYLVGYLITYLLFNNLIAILVICFLFFILLLNFRAFKIESKTI